MLGISLLQLGEREGPSPEKQRSIEHFTVRERNSYHREVDKDSHQHDKSRFEGHAGEINKQQSKNYTERHIRTRRSAKHDLFTRFTIAGQIVLRARFNHYAYAEVSHLLFYVVGHLIDF